MALLEGRRIFVVEDNSENRIIMRILLTQAGARVEFDLWGVTAVEKLREFEPVDLILLDLMLGRGSSGYQVYESIRALPEFAKIPIIAVSATDPAQAVPRCKSLGFNGFIPKPVNDDVFADQLAQVIAGQPVWETNLMR
jgi:two-component system sensor histidine kinase/response regulator